MKKILFLAFVFTLSAQGIALAAQEAPPPRKMPRTPVNRQVLVERKAVVPPGSMVQGQATVIDSEKLRIGDIDMRLFGIVPPQLSASFGPQARSALDKMVAGQPVNCMVRDRDQAGRYLATCRNGSNVDIAVEMLRRGLAVTARGSLSATDLSATYLAAEEAAQSQKAGLWSGVQPAPAALHAVASPAIVPAPLPIPSATITPPPQAPAVQHENLVAEATPALAEKATKAEQAKNTNESVDARINSAPLPASTLLPVDAADVSADNAPNFFARYQLLITGLLMMATALSILWVLAMQRRNEKRDDMKALAAALRGELTAARGICVARLKAITNEAEDKAASWPRLRASLYHAYVGKLGWLGADLARQVASIYGQASDYAAFYQLDDDSKVETKPKQQALKTLVHYIEEVLPKLAHIEQTGERLSSAGSRTHQHDASASVGSVAENSSTISSPQNAVADVTQSITVPLISRDHPVWDKLRSFTRERFVEKKPQRHAGSEHDYAAQIEDEMANLTFGENEDDDFQSASVHKIRPTGS